MNQLEEDNRLHIVLLANQPRMFRTMLRQILENLPGAQLTLEVKDPWRIPAVLERVRADWLIASLTENGQLPATAIEVAAQNPDLSVMGISTDGNHLEIQLRTQAGERIEQLRHALDGVSLDELLLILCNHKIQSSQKRGRK